MNHSLESPIEEFPFCFARAWHSLLAERHTEKRKETRATIQPESLITMTAGVWLILCRAHWKDYVILKED